MIKTVELVAEGNYVPLPQSELTGKISELKAAPKIFKNDCKINWEQSGKKIYDFIRGLSPYPAAWTIFQSIEGDKVLNAKIFEAEFVKEEHEMMIADMDSNKKTYLHIAVPDGFIAIKSIQLEGKKRLKIEDFLRGFDIENYLIDPKPSCLL